jgi:phosphoglycolate phosphatase
MKIKLIIFDLDGTLVNSGADITNALNYAIRPYGYEQLTVERTISLVGEGVTRLIEKLLGRKAADLKDVVLKRFLEYYSEHLADFTVPYPGVRETLEVLGNYRKAVISNKREDLSKLLLDKLGLSGYLTLYGERQTVWLCACSGDVEETVLRLVRQLWSVTAIMT